MIQATIGLGIEHYVAEGLKQRIEGSQGIGDRVTILEEVLKDLIEELAKPPTVALVGPGVVIG